MQTEDVIKQWQPESDLLGKSFVNTYPFKLEMDIVKTERQVICYLCEELSDAWQWDLAYESRAWTKDESHWNEYDQMDV